MHQIVLRDPVLKDNLKRLFQYCHDEFLDFEDMLYIFCIYEGYSLSEIVDAILEGGLD